MSFFNRKPWGCMTFGEILFGWFVCATLGILTLCAIAAGASLGQLVFDGLS